MTLSILTKGLVLAVLCLTAAFKAKAQEYGVSGLILDAFTREKLDSVTVRFLSTDSVERMRFVNASDGWWNFDEKIKAPGKYIIHFSRKGYEDTYKNVDFKYKKYRVIGGTFGEVIMHKKSTLRDRHLGEAVVTATKIKMVMKGDTIVYNADAFQLHEGSMLDQLIAMLPGVELKTGGEMYVNGKKVSSLLVNGEDFFKGNPRVALENLPAFMVDKVKVYEKGPDWERLVKMSPDEYRPGNDNLVVDVNLKRQYSVGWIANAALGGGTGDHYSARAFGLRFTPQSRLAFMGYSNNVYGNSYYDANGNWQNPGGSANLRTHELANDLLINDKRKRYKINNTLTFKSTRQTDENYQSTVSYLGERNIYGVKSSHSTYRNWSLRSNGKVEYTPVGLGSAGSNFSFQPDLYYIRYSNDALSRSADHDRELAERYMGESLDSLFFDGSSVLYRRNLISSLRQRQKGDGHYAYANGSLTGFVMLKPDYLTFSANGMYYDEGNRSLFDAAAYDGANHQRRFADNTAWGYKYGASTSYNYGLKIDGLNISMRPEYGFSLNRRAADRPYYRLEDTDWTDDDLDRLASAKAMMRDCIDPYNTVRSDSRQLTHRAAANLNLNHWNPNTRQSHTLDITLPARFLNDRLDYARGAIDTLVRNNYTFFEPNVQYRLDCNDQEKSREYHVNLSYGLTESEPPAEYLTGYRDDTTPLTVRVGNRNLKSTRRHETNASYSNLRYGSKYTFFSISAGYTIWQDMLCQAMAYDDATGVRTYRPDNIGGNWQLRSALTWHSAFDKKRRFNYTTETNFTYRRSADYAELEQAASSSRATVDRFVTRQSFNMYYSHNGYSFAARLNAEWTHATSDRFATLDALNINYGVNGGVPLPGKFQIRTNLTLYSRYGYSNSAFNTSQLIWSANLSRAFARGRVKVELEAFDILNKMSAYSYAVDAQMQTETWRNVLRRYLMLNVTFRLNKEPKKRP